MSNTVINNSLLHDKSLFNKPSQKLTYIYLTSFVNCEKVFPSIDTIAGATCQSERNAMRVIKELEELGAIRVERSKGKANVYTLVSYEELTNCQQPVTECHTISSSLVNINNNINTTNKLTNELVINELIEQYPDVPVQEIASELESDSSVDIRTVKQFKGLLTYRVKNYKPSNVKPFARKKTRVEVIPEHMESDYVAPAPQTTRTMNDILANLKSAGF